MDVYMPSEIFHCFRKENTKFNLVVDNNKSKKDFVFFRSSITSKGATELVKELGKFSNTNWIVNKIRNPKKLLFSKTWACQQSSCRKKILSKRNSRCGARILIKIKEINEENKKSDEFLCLPLPLPTEIRIDLKHSHQIAAVDSLRMLRVSDEVQEKYFSYFRHGLTPAVAKRFHEDNLLLNDSYIIDLANSSKNPTFRQVLHLYEKWREINIRLACDPYCKLYEESGCPAKLEDVEDPDWAPSVNMGYPTNEVKKTRLSPYVEYLRNCVVEENKSEKTVSCNQQSSVNVKTLEDHSSQDSDSSNDSDKWYFINSDESTNDTATKHSISSEEYGSEEIISGQNLTDERVLSLNTNTVESKIIFVKAFNESKDS